MLPEYFPVLLFLIIATGIALVMTAVPFVVGIKNPDKEKNSPYECGFEAFGDARGRFDVRFYLVAILFIIFDLEVAFLFPWAMSFGDMGVLGVFVVGILAALALCFFPAALCFGRAPAL